MTAAGLDPVVAAALACPETRQALEPREGGLLRADGRVVYPVRDGVPSLFPGDGRPADAPAAALAGESEDGSGFSAEQIERLASLEGRHFWFAGRRELVARLLKSRLAHPGGLVLDVGCGAGATLELLARHGQHSVGLDVSLEGLQAVRRAHPRATVLRGDGTRLPFRDATLDGAVAMDVLEHLDDRACAAELHRALKPGGWLLVSVPAGPWLWSHTDEVAGHLRRYTRATVRRLLDESGFEVETLVPYQFLLFPLVAVTRLLGRRRHELRERELEVPRRANRVLTAVARLEGRTPLPWPTGSSLVAVSRRRDG